MLLAGPSGAAKGAIQAEREAKLAFTQLRRRLQNVQSERVMVERQLAALGDRKQTFSAAGSIEGAVHPDLLHFRRLLEPADGGKEFLISKEKGLIDRSAPRIG